MRAYVGVSITRTLVSPAPTARYARTGLPPGTYTVEAWHEKPAHRPPDGNDWRQGIPRRCLYVQADHLSEAARETTNMWLRLARAVSACPHSVRAGTLMLHRFAALVAAATAVLIYAGGLVTSTGSGLSVPDWPNTYGWFMFSFPLDKMVGGIWYEHSHRLIASVVGFLILVLAIWLWRAEPRTWVRRLGYTALIAVVTQGVLGGITVLWFLPDPISIAHAGLAQLVFCLTLTITLVTSAGWRRGHPANDRTLQTITAITVVATYVQILIGATMRHTGAGLAIPDFPLAFGHVMPPSWSAGIAIHYAHRVGAVVVSFLVVATAGHVLHHHRERIDSGGRRCCCSPCWRCRSRSAP